MDRAAGRSGTREEEATAAERGSGSNGRNVHTAAANADGSSHARAYRRTTLSCCCSAAYGPARPATSINSLVRPTHGPSVFLLHFLLAVSLMAERLGARSDHMRTRARVFRRMAIALSPATTASICPSFLPCARPVFPRPTALLFCFPHCSPRSIPFDASLFNHFVPIGRFR